MPKRKHKREAGSAKTDQSVQIAPRGFRGALRHPYRYWGYLWGVLGPVLSVFGLWYSNYPSISIVPGTQLDPSDSFSVPFTIRNDNRYALHNVHIVFGLDRVRSSIDGGARVNFTHCSFEPPARAPLLEARTSVTRVARMTSRGLKISEADISVNVTYEPLWCYPSARCFKQQYKAYITEAGTVYWMATSTRRSPP